LIINVRSSDNHFTSLNTTGGIITFVSSYPRDIFRISRINVALF